MAGVASSPWGEFFGRLVNWGVPKRKPTTLQEADDLTRPMIKRWVTVAVSVSWVPGSTFVLAGVDYKLFHDIARIYGIPDFNVDAMVAAIGGTIVGRGAAEGLGWAFGIGWFTNPIVAGVITKKLADTIMDYMRTESPLK